jgi:hypothetical protein
VIRSRSLQFRENPGIFDNNGWVSLVIRLTLDSCRNALENFSIVVYEEVDGPVQIAALEIVGLSRG